MYKQFNRRNFFLSIAFDLIVGAMVGAGIMTVFVPILGRIPSFMICAAAGVVIGTLSLFPFPWYTYPEGE